MGSRKHAKVPRTAVKTSSAKAPATATGVLPSREEIMRRRIVWKFADADHDSGWNFSCLDGAGLVDILRKLGDFESMTVREIFYSGEEPGKEYEVTALPAHTHARLTEIGREDETRLARLRLSGAQRLYGFMREHVFHVLWWDPEHQVFPSRKKHT